MSYLIIHFNVNAMGRERIRCEGQISNYDNKLIKQNNLIKYISKHNQKNIKWDALVVKTKVTARWFLKNQRVLLLPIHQLSLIFKLSANQHMKTFLLSFLIKNYSQSIFLKKKKLRWIVWKMIFSYLRDLKTSTNTNTISLFLNSSEV